MTEEIERAVKAAFDEGFRAGEAKTLESFKIAVGRIAGGEAFAVTTGDVPSPELVPIATAAKMFKINANAIYVAIRKGKVKARKAEAPKGSRTAMIQVVSLDDVKRWREAN